MGHYDDQYDAVDEAEREYLRIHSEAKELRDQLMAFPAGVYTVNELQFILKMDWSRYKDYWTGLDLAKLQAIAARVNRV